MLNILKRFAKCVTASAFAPHDLASAGHGVDRPISPASAASLASDRRGRLKNGNRCGDFLASPRCGAKTRAGCCCRQHAMRNGRCRLHGGLSTGSRTVAGLARSRRARLSHGGRSAHARALLAEARAHPRRVRALAAIVNGRPAGHGVHRPLFAPPPPTSRPVPA